MKHFGHTLFNDSRYGGDSILKGTSFSKYRHFIENCFKILPRQALHAISLSLRHPKSGEIVSFNTDLPLDLKNIINRWFGIRSRPGNEASPILRSLEKGLIVCTGFYKNGILLAPACSNWISNEIENHLL